MVKNFLQENSEITRLRKVNQELEEQNFHLERGNVLLEERLKKLQERLRELELSREEIERSLRMCNVVVYGIPVLHNNSKAEPPAELMSKMEKAFNFSFAGKLNSCYRLRPGTRNERVGIPVLIKFFHPVYKYEFINHVNGKRLTADIFGGLPAVRIYANEHLTPHRANLYREANNLKAQGKLHVWIQSGRVFVSRTSDAPGVEVHSLQEIREIASLPLPTTPIPQSDQQANQTSPNNQTNVPEQS